MKEPLFLFLWALGMLFSLGPFEYFGAGLLSALFLILAVQNLEKCSYSRVLILSGASSFFCTFICFPWVTSGLSNLSGIRIEFSFLIVFLFSFVMQFKMYVFFISCRILFPYFPEKHRIWVIALSAFTVDKYVFQIFPWHFGDMSAGSSFFRELAFFFGVNGISFFIFFPAAFLIFIFRKYAEKNEAVSSLREIRSVFTVIVIIILLIVFKKSAPQGISGKLLALAVQTNTELGLKSASMEDSAGKALNRVFLLGVKALYSAEYVPDIVIFPETAVPFLNTEPFQKNYSSTMYGIILYLSSLSGSDIVWNEPYTSRNGTLNTLAHFSHRSKTKERYEKNLLVPFGENLPFSESFPFLNILFPESSKYVKSENRTMPKIHYRKIYKEKDYISLDKINTDILQKPSDILNYVPRREDYAVSDYIPLLCYESLFPDYVRSFTEKGYPGFLLSLANDSWFGNYLENWQHETGARFRAVESGRAFIRVTLSGVTSLILPDGSSVHPLESGKEGFGLYEIPLYTGKTVFYRFPALMELICFAVLVFAFRNRFFMKKR